MSAYAPPHELEQTSLQEQIERHRQECAALSLQLLGVGKQRNASELAAIDAERRLVDLRGQERLIRQALSQANRDLITKQAILKSLR